ncbi:hypothetical protein BV210_05775 [Halorientalis sp. IM1011]|uniref:hypothetical protein n=1 Tax=Halorientalis sp. IM1011 TaxID=1932360 RepID=UPI00097CCB2E|nr:hypothetical protein [Halorientalis sp. IM1011]AQL42251.1 hypothetical protein BV210_05775 [Halorientalis sp. IM1011]
MDTGSGVRCVVLVAVLFAVPGLGAATGDVGQDAGADDYNVTVADAVETPTRTVSLEGEEFDVSAVAQRRPGERIDVTVAAPDAGYDLYLYDADRNIRDTSRQRGPAEAAFDTEGLEVGTYVVAVYRQGEFLDVFPVVVAGYDVTVSTPAETVTDRTARVPVTVTSTGDRSAPDAVEVVVGDRNRSVRTTATRVEDGEYVANVDVSRLPAGTYRAYASVIERRPDARDQSLGISDGATLTVGDTPPPTSQPGNSKTIETTDGSGSSADVLTPNGNDGPSTTAGTGRSTAVALLTVALLGYGLVTALRRRR